MRAEGAPEARNPQISPNLGSDQNLGFLNKGGGRLQIPLIRFTSLYLFELLVSCGMIIFLELKPLGISSNRDDHGI